MDMLDRYHFRFCEAEVLDCSFLMLLVSFPEIIAGKKVDISARLFAVAISFTNVNWLILIHYRTICFSVQTHEQQTADLVT